VHAAARDGEVAAGQRDAVGQGATPVQPDRRMPGDPVH
jgi:hypothetical protein